MLNLGLLHFLIIEIVFSLFKILFFTLLFKLILIQHNINYIKTSNMMEYFSCPTYPGEHF